jgi:epsin
MSMFDGFKSGLKSAGDKIMRVSEPERLVKDATNLEKWGPSGTQMREIAEATFIDSDLPVLIAALFKRLSEPGKYWRHVYKSLLVMDYILKNGSEEVIHQCRERLIEIQTLTQFQHIDEEDGKDAGLNVRERPSLCWNSSMMTSAYRLSGRGQPQRGPSLWEWGQRTHAARSGTA